MNKTRRLVRLYLVMLLLVLLPIGGFLWNVPNHLPYVALTGVICLGLAICIESIMQLTERDALHLQLKARQDAETISELKEKVRELERFVTMTSLENDELRRDELTRKMRDAGDAKSATV